MYNLLTELKLEILSYLPFNESKHLYNEFKCKIPINIVKNWYKYVLSELLSDNTKFGFGCNSSFNLSPKLCKILNLPMYIQLTYSNISVRLHNYIKMDFLSCLPATRSESVRQYQLLILLHHHHHHNPASNHLNSSTESSICKNL